MALDLQNGAFDAWSPASLKKGVLFLDNQVYSLDMAYSQKDLDNIKSAIVSGHQTVEINGRRVTYRDFADLLNAKQLIEESLSGSKRLYPRYQTADFR